MKNLYHEKRILNAISKYDQYHLKQQEVYKNLIKLLGISSNKNSRDLRYFFRNYPEDQSYNYLLKSASAPKAMKLIDKYQKYHAIKKNYSKLIFDYRKNYLDDAGCNLQRRKDFLKKSAIIRFF